MTTCRARTVPAGGLDLHAVVVVCGCAGPRYPDARDRRDASAMAAATDCAPAVKRRSWAHPSVSISCSNPPADAT